MDQGGDHGGKTIRSISYSGALGDMRPGKWTSAAPKQRSVVFDLDRVNVHGLAVIELDDANL